MKRLICLLLLFFALMPFAGAYDFKDMDNAAGEIRAKMDKIESEIKARDVESQQIRQEQKIKALEEKIRKIEGSIA